MVEIVQKNIYNIKSLYSWGYERVKNDFANNIYDIDEAKEIKKRESGYDM